MKDIVKRALESAPTVSQNTFQSLQQVVSKSVEEALDVSFSESESTILAHAVVGIISSRAATKTGTDWKSSHPVTKKQRTTAKDEQLLSSSCRKKQIQSVYHTAASKMSHLPRRSPRNVKGRANNSTLMDLDSDGILSQIFTYLPFEDLNSIATCNRRLLTLRSDPSLDQTRSITLNFRNDRQGNSFDRLLEAIERYGLQDRFAGNRRELRLRGYLENFDDNSLSQTTDPNRFRLLGVTMLDLQGERKPANPFIYIFLAFSSDRTIKAILPNVVTLNISGVKSIMLTPFDIKAAFPRLQTLLAYDCNDSNFFTGVASGAVLRVWSSLTEMYTPNQKRWENHSLHLALPPHIERLDIRSFRTQSVHSTPLPESELIDILQHCRSLRWLRCTASSQTLKRLKKQRPDVTIINF